MTTSKIICPLKQVSVQFVRFQFPIHRTRARVPAINGNIITFRENGSPFSSAAARLEAEETISKRPKNLIRAFNGTDAAVLKAEAAIPAIAVSGERAPPNDAERAAAFLADFERNTEKTRAQHESNPGEGDGNSRLMIEITYPAHLTRPGISVPQTALKCIQGNQGLPYLIQHASGIAGGMQLFRGASGFHKAL
jgi:hypothetical protein